MSPSILVGDADDRARIAHFTGVGEGSGVTSPGVELVRPDREHLGSYVQALRRGWAPDDRAELTIEQRLRMIEADPAVFLAGLDDRDAPRPPVSLPDGGSVARLLGFQRWLWDGEFCGRISLRWQPGTVDLPAHVLGHVGYAVVPWKRGLGYAKSAVAQLLPEARALGLPYLEIATDVDNIASQRVLAANGACLVAQFDLPASYGGGSALRYRIDLQR